MKVESTRDFFYKQISITSVLMPEDCKLTNIEILFLVECCMYHYNGNDLSDFKGLSDHFLGIRFFKTKERVSLYKYKLSAKKWVKSKKGEFLLPNSLSKTKKDNLYFKFELEHVK